MNLFNSRRIGATPNYFDPDSGDLENVSDNTTIITIKLIGTTNSGINYGFINARLKKNLVIYLLVIIKIDSLSNLKLVTPLVN